MRQNLRPPEGAIGISRQEGHGVSKIALALQENLERCALPGNDRASFGIVADAVTIGEPSSGRRRTVDFFGRAQCALYWNDSSLGLLIEGDLGCPQQQRVHVCRAKSLRPTHLREASRWRQPAGRSGDSPQPP